MSFFKKHLKEILFIAAVLAVAGALYLFTHPHAEAATAVLQYGNPQQEMRIDLSRDARYDVDTGHYTIHLQVHDGGIAFIDSPCPDHLCEGFGVLRSPGDWAACLPAQASITIEAKE